MIPALAFVPPQDVIATFEELCDELPAESQPVIDYFEDTYVGRPQYRGRRPPIIGNDLWNMFDRAQDELPRTNNFVEDGTEVFSLTLSIIIPIFGILSTSLNVNRHYNKST